jgi:hypothetical protein
MMALVLACDVGRYNRFWRELDKDRDDVNERNIRAYELIKTQGVSRHLVCDRD